METENKKTLYEQIYDDLLKGIQEGKWKEGERVPTEKELSSTYNVSRITSKKALDKLASQDIIKRYPGRGSFVNAISEDLPSLNVEDSTPLGKTDKRPSKLIGLVIEDFAEAFGTIIISGIERTLSKAGYSLILRRSYGMQTEESKAIKTMLDLGVDGLIIMPVHGTNYNKEILRLSLQQFPTVLVDRELKGIPLSYVGTDNFSSAKKLTEYLIRSGHRKIGFVAPSSLDTSSVLQRKEGFERAHRDSGILIDENLVLSQVYSTLPGKTPADNLKADLRVLEAYLRKKREMTAVFAVEYNIASALWLAAYNMGLKVPEDLEIVCFDSPSSNIDRYPFTHMHQNQEKIGEESALQVLNLIKGDTEVRDISIPADLILRMPEK